MQTMEKSYLDLLDVVLMNGEQRMDRTGVGTISLFGRQIRGDLSRGFPLLTTKKVAWKPIVGELLWFIEGSSDERRLCEITYGTRDPSRTTIWTANANADYWKPKAKFEGDLGRVYGVQWRNWTHNGKTFDQLANIIHKLKTNPADRRMVLTAFNVGEMDQMALPPCHMFAQFHVSPTTSQLNCQVYIRSNDLFLGLPFNMASYALLVHMMAQVTDLFPGELIITIGDAHIYLNHIEQVKEQLSRDMLHAPKLKLNPAIKDIDGFSMNDIELLDYVSHPAIKADMAV